jgi:hypothetical protein
VSTQDADTICDRCAVELVSWEANDMPTGEWLGCMICNDCYAQIGDGDDVEPD